MSIKKTHVFLNGIEGNGSALNDSVLLLDCVLNGGFNHGVELFLVLECPNTGRNLGHKDHQQEAEEL